MAMLTTDANSAFLPDEAHSLIVQPTAQESVALAVSNVVHAKQTSNVYRVPTVTDDPSAGWVDEGEEINLSAATLGEVASPFYKIACLTAVSRELASDSSPGAAELVGQGIARDIAKKIDAAFFGSNLLEAGPPEERIQAQPRGLGDLNGITYVDVDDALENTDPFAEAISNAESEGATLTALVAHPEDALALSTVKRGTDSNEALLQVDATQPTRRLVQGLPLHVSPYVPEGTIYAIPKDRSIVVIREDVDLRVDESALFSYDMLAIRATMRMAFLFPHAAAVNAITVYGDGGS